MAMVEIAAANSPPKAIRPEMNKAISKVI